MTIALMTLSSLGTGCSVGKQPGSSLGELKEHQERMLAIDERAAQTDPTAVEAADRLHGLADDYAEVVNEARSTRPDEARGAEAICWDAFIEILRVREQSARTYANAADGGDLSAARVIVAQLDERTITLNDRFNRALAEFRDDEPPG